MELWTGALNLGFLYAFMAAGVLITFRILNFADITVDGSFTTGAAVTAVLITSGTDPLIALLCGFLASSVAGVFTGLIHTKMKIHGLLAGILVMVGLYSINLRIMKKSNISLLDHKSFITVLNSFNPGLPGEMWLSLCLILIMALFWILFSLFFKTDLGITIRAAGDNPQMSLASGVNTDAINILGLALANGLTGLSGGLVAQYQGFSDIGMGIGTLMIGLASVIIGESVLKKSSVYIMVLSAITGSLVYRLMIALALHFGMNPVDLKLFTSIFVLITLYLTKTGPESKKGGWLLYFKEHKKLSYAVGSIAIILLLFFSGKSFFKPSVSNFYKIGVLQLADNGLLNITRDSFAGEMEKIGYINGKNCKIDMRNAQGDMPTVNTILDTFIMKKYDVIVPISTGVTQAAINKTQTIPVVFATVANPFILKAGVSDSEHRENVTGVYGWVPMDRTLEIVTTLYPGELKIGAMYDPSQVNAVFNVENLEKEVGKNKNIIMEKVIITNSSEVYEAARSLTQKDIDIFLLPPDNIVYSAFDSIVKAGDAKGIPICVTDTERLKDGALIAYGYDYRASGIQAAHIVDRILKGENPRNIPFEVYRKLDLGINLETAKKLNIKLPHSLLSEATIIIEEDGKVTYKDKRDSSEVIPPASPEKER